MKAILLNEAGGVENFQYSEIPTPQIEHHEVLIKVQSIGINPIDVNARAYEGVLDWIFQGERPVILGWDISGEVIEKGKEVSEFEIGDEVFGLVNFFGKGNAYAEYVKSPAKHLAKKPKNVTYQEAAVSSLAATTAYQALVDVAKLKKGDRVLIHAASGGVGHFAVQIAKHFGAYVIGTSSSGNKDFVLSLGADEHTDYQQSQISEISQKVDVVLDTIQGTTLVDSIGIVRPQGMIITLPSPEIPDEVKSEAGKQDVNVLFHFASSKKETVSAIAELLEKNIIKPKISKQFPFSEMGEAHKEVESKRVVGKVVVNL